MATIYTTSFHTWDKQFREVELLSEHSRSRSTSFATTFITGRNGSHKSTLLMEIVTELTSVGRSSNESAGYVQRPLQDQVLCVSGSVADRFPQKVPQGRRRSPFDVPNYTYVGQRVVSNMLSKKAPLETMLTFALDPEKAERCGWNFFGAAHSYAGIRPCGKYMLEVQRDKLKKGQVTTDDFLGIVQGIQPEFDDTQKAVVDRLRISYATAQWLLEQFSYEEFLALQFF
jgi:hypothetical protein